MQHVYSPGLDTCECSECSRCRGCR